MSSVPIQISPDLKYMAVFALRNIIYIYIYIYMCVYFLFLLQRKKPVNRYPFLPKFLQLSSNFKDAVEKRQSYLASMTNSSFFNWRFWSYEKFCMSHMLTRMQKWKIGDYKFFNFFVNTKLYFSSQCEHGLSLAACRPFTTTPEGMSCLKAVHLENYCRLTYLW